MRLFRTVLATTLVVSVGCNNVDHAKKADDAKLADTATTAKHADAADTATTATSATSATTAQDAAHATAADTAKQADKATDADDSSELGGKAPEQYELASDAAKKVAQLTAAAPLVVGGPDAQHPALSLARAAADVDGFLAKEDFLAFAAKQKQISVQGPLALDPSAKLTIAQASTAADGALSHTDFALFAAKQNALSVQGPLALDAGGARLSIGAASAAADGFLTKQDYAAFSAKQAAITAKGALSLDSAGSLTIVNAGHAVAAGALTGTDWDAFNNKAAKTGEAGYIQNAPTSAQAASLNITGTATFGGNVTAATGAKFVGDGSGLTGVQPGSSFSATSGTLAVALPNTSGSFAANDGGVYLVTGKLFGASELDLFTYIVHVSAASGSAAPAFVATKLSEVTSGGTFSVVITRPSATTINIDSSSTSLGVQKSVRVTRLF